VKRILHLLALKKREQMGGEQFLQRTAAT